ncbi:nucleotidyl transferase AbiEii/AbiGii toxin family protein [Daejeonella sp.]|uniref:nucleotidyl transferase AbiEii/AbiGii toxin family protein n=1 Tax=Daejeonella sp. TaxID=2805397 RepID=UPI0030BFB73D
MLKIDFTRLRSEALPDIIRAFEECLNQMEIDYYLIGALARDAWFQQEDIASRRTADVDFAILVPEREKFDDLKHFLSTEKGYVETKNNSFAMITPGGITVDILPFGSIEIDEEVNIANGHTQVATNGFREIYQSALESFESEDGDVRVKVASLPGIVLLKLIAHGDRPEIRMKDPGDILEIFKHYFDLNTAFIFENHDNVFETEQTLEVISARVIGREIGKIASGNSALYARVLSYLNGELEKRENSSLIRLMLRSEYGYNEEDIMLMLRNMAEGIEEIQ